eukprot:11214766-Lingulodinium_polyedra.AAC.1
MRCNLLQYCNAAPCARCLRHTPGKYAAFWTLAATERQIRKFPCPTSSSTPGDPPSEPQYFMRLWDSTRVA